MNKQINDDAQARKDRIIARGEVSGHSHVVVGEDVEIKRNAKGEVLIGVGNSGAVIKHLIENDWMHGVQTWTKEHKDIELAPNKTYTYVPQTEKDPYDDKIRQVTD